MGITATPERIGTVQVPSGPSIHVSFEGIRYEIGSWREVQSAEGGMVEATMWSQGSRFPRVEIIEQTW